MTIEISRQAPKVEENLFESGSENVAKSKWHLSGSMHVFLIWHRLCIGPFVQWEEFDEIYVFCSIGFLGVFTVFHSLCVCVWLLFVFCLRATWCLFGLLNLKKKKTTKPKTCAQSVRSRRHAVIGDAPKIQRPNEKLLTLGINNGNESTREKKLQQKWRRRWR